MTNIVDINIFNVFEIDDIVNALSEEAFNRFCNAEIPNREYIDITYSDGRIDSFDFESMVFDVHKFTDKEISEYSKLSITKKNYEIIGIKFLENSVEVLIKQQGGCCSGGQSHLFKIKCSPILGHK